MTILVSGASGVVGYGILKTLRNSGHRLIGTTIYNFSVAPAFCDVAEIILPTNHQDYMDDLCGIIRKHRVDMIIPSIECDMYKWNNERQLIQTFSLLNNPQLINLCYDKWLFYNVLRSEKPDYAIPTKNGNEFKPFSIPFLLKPRHGYGSKGIIKIYDYADYDNHRSDIELDNLIIQPVVGSDDEEYTVSGFFDKGSNLIDYFPLKRKLSSEGFTGEAEVADRGFKEILIDLAETFKPVGPTNFQFRFDGDQPKLLEINPRISSATSIRAAFGYNEAVMSIDYFLSGKIPEAISKPIGRKAIRYTEDLIF